MLTRENGKNRLEVDLANDAEFHAIWDRFIEAVHDDDPIEKVLVALLLVLQAACLDLKMTQEQLAPLMTRVWDYADALVEQAKAAPEVLFDSGKKDE